MQFALFVTGLLWLLAAHTAAQHLGEGIATRFTLTIWQPLLQEIFFLLLLLFGSTALSWIATRTSGIRRNNALPKRETSAHEWQLGAALGWILLLAAVLPMMAAGSLHPAFWFAPRAWMLAGIALITIATGTLALEVAFRGYIFQRLIDATGPVVASILLSIVYALFASFRPNSTSLSVFVTFLAGLLFSMAYLRTHALWLGWGLHFAWNAAMGVLFGLPVGGVILYSSLVDTDTGGAAWLTGGAYGPEGALFTAALMIIGMFVLYRVTRDYAWQYTHAPIVAAGIAMEVAPPKAHTDMEAATAAKPAPLVQIISTTPTAPSTMPVIADHLSSDKND